jgi:hypothetical protein
MEPVKDKLDKLIPDRGSLPSPGLANAINDLQTAEAEKLLDSERRAKARRLRAKVKYYKNKYGPEYEPEFDEEGNYIEPLYPPELTTKTILKEDDYEIVTTPLIDDEKTDVMFTGQYAHLNGTTSPQIARLFKRLNIDETVRLTKSEMFDLVATLMMCNEKQLKAILNNRRVPAAVRIIVKALETDMKVGSLDTVEKLWDRIFGKPSQTANIIDERPVSALQELLPGVKPGKTISREAYLLIKERLFGD